MTALHKLSWMTTGAIALGTLTVLVGVGRGNQFWQELSRFWQFTSPAKVDVRAGALQQIRAASELTTAVFAMEAIVPTQQDRELGGVVLGTTKLLYIAYGEVRAGVDLNQIEAQNITVNGDTVQVQLPPPQVLDAKLDVNRSQVYEYNRGFLGLGPDNAPTLQTLAQQQALQKIVSTACNTGLMQTARDRAQQVVTHLLSGAGYNQVSVTVQAPKANSCVLPPA